MGQSSFSGPVASQNGFIPGSFTTAELAAMTGVTTGTLVFNTTTNVAQVYNGTAWVAAFAPAVAAPTVTAISPNTGTDAGGTSVTITGTGFTTATGAKIGGVAVTSFVVVNDTTITCVTPAGSDGAQSVNVTNAGGTNANNSLFTYTHTTTYTFVNSTDYSGSQFGSSPAQMVFLSPDSAFQTAAALLASGNIVTLNSEDGNIYTVTLAEAFVNSGSSLTATYSAATPTPGVGYPLNSITFTV